MAPAEYAPSAVAAASQPTEQLPYSGLVRAGEPYASLLRRDFHHGAAGGLGVHSDEAERHRNNPAPGLDYTNENLFYNTAAAEAYWKDKGLPRPTSDIRQLRRDLVDWGYCLVSNALSESQLKAVRSRVYEQADGEIKAGVAYWGASPPPPGKAVPPVQLVHSLLNKGDVFRGVVEYDPQFVQGGPVIEQLIKEVLGDNFLISTFLSLITSAGNLPQNMHQVRASGASGGRRTLTDRFPLLCSIYPLTQPNPRICPFFNRLPTFSLGSVTYFARSLIPRARSIGPSPRTLPNPPRPRIMQHHVSFGRLWTHKRRNPRHPRKPQTDLLRRDPAQEPSSAAYKRPRPRGNRAHL